MKDNLIALGGFLVGFFALFCHLNVLDNQTNVNTHKDNPNNYKI